MERDEITALTQEIAKKLNETDEQPLKQIELIIEQMGREFIEEVMQDVEKVEAKGGMKTEDGSRKRTIGGVFFYIAKGKMPPDKRNLIFPNFGQAAKGKSVEWHERREHIDPLLEAGEHGEMQFVSITLQGRPGKIEILDNSVMTTIEHVYHRSPLPRGVPFPPDDPIIYTVYMGIKQWNGVAENIEKYRKDKLIIEGTFTWDKETETFAVFATRVTSKRTEKQARKEQEKQASADGATEKAPTQRPEPVIVPPAPPATDVDVPEGMSTKDADKLRQLYGAAAKLETRIAEMEEKGQPGIKMTKKLLANTQRQIDTLERQYS